MAAKDTLISDLEDYFRNAGNGDYPSLAIGVPVFVKAVEDFCKLGLDSLGNPCVGFSGTPLQIAMLTLVPTDLTDIPATQLATGLLSCWSATTLSVTNLPPTATSPVSNVIDSVPAMSGVKADFKEILDADFNAILNASPGPDKVGYYITELANMWADVIEKTGQECGFLFSYLGPAPAFPPLSLSGQITFP